VEALKRTATAAHRPTELMLTRVDPGGDGGLPFASPNALFNLSKLAVWWLRLGIAIERCPHLHLSQENQPLDRPRRTTSASKRSTTAFGS